MSSKEISLEDDLTINKLSSDVKESIIVSLDNSTQKTIESSQIQVWLKSNGRYGLKLKNSGSTVFYGTDSAYANIIRSGSFPTGYPKNFPDLTLKSFTVNSSGVIEQVRTDGEFDYTLRISIVNATSLGGYMKVEMDMKNITSSSKNVGLSFNMDTMINGNDAAPFRIVENGWEVFTGGVQATAYYQDVFNVTQADSIYLGRYSQQYPMPVNSFYVGQPDIYPGDSGAGFYYNLESVSAGATRTESWIIGVGPKNANPAFNLSAPADNSTFYSGQIVPISGIVKDTDVGDVLTVKWAIDNGAENIITNLIASGSNQSFSYNYVIPSNLSQGWHTFQFWVMDDKGGMSSSNSRQIYVNNFVVPGVPTFSSVTNSSMVVSFDKKNNEPSTTYELTNITTNSSTNLGTGNQLSFSGLPVNTQYSFKARAKNTSNVYTDYSGTGSRYTLANTPVVGSIDSSVAGKATLSWGSNGNPSYTKYHYEIRRKDNNTVSKSGDVTSPSVVVSDIPTDIYYNVYVKAINGDGVYTGEILLGELYQDATKPVLSYSINPTTWTKNDVVITVIASDSGSGLKNVILPNNSITTNATNTYTVNSNGTYTFSAVDNHGNKNTLDVVVSNIDKVNPTPPIITNNTNWTTDKSVSVKLSGGSDSLSGLNRLEYKTDKSDNWFTFTDAFSISNLGITKITARSVDNVGNYSDEVISYVRIDNPSIFTVTKDITGWTNKDVTISISATDLDGSVVQILLPDGSVVNSNSATFKATSNNSYKFIAVDSEGNRTEHVVTISNIDKIKPSAPVINLSNYNWTVPGVTFTISNLLDSGGSGFSKVEYKVGTYDWKVYTPSSTVEVPRELQGLIPLSARVYDVAGNISEISSVNVKIDNLIPVIDKLSILPHDFETYKLKVYAHDDESGLHTSAYKYYQKIHGSDSSYKLISSNFVSSSELILPVSKSSSLYSYKVEVRDLNNNLSLMSSSIDYVSAPVVSKSYVGGEEFGNTATIKFDNVIGKDVVVEVYREGNFVGELSNVDKYIDKGLDYERSYTYKFIAYSLVNGVRVTSLPEVIDIKVGSPKIELTHSKIYYRTIFSERFNIDGNVEYRKGGVINFKIYNDSNTLVKEEDISVLPSAPQSFVLKYDDSLTTLSTYKLVVDLKGSELSKLYKKEFNINLDLKGPVVNDVSDSKNHLYYGN